MTIFADEVIDVIEELDAASVDEEDLAEEIVVAVLAAAGNVIGEGRVFALVERAKREGAVVHRRRAV